jgi:hypothetical protein
VRVARDEMLVEGIVGLPNGPFKVIHLEVIFQLSHFRLHLLRICFALVMCQGLFSKHEFIQLMRNIKVGVVLLHPRSITGEG